MGKMIPLEETKKSILESIDDANIFSLEKTHNGYELGESCDYYFWRTLTQEQFERLIQELIEMSKKPFDGLGD